MIDKEKYKSLLAIMESGNDYSKINSIGALGKYQFLPSTLNGLKSKYNLPSWNNAAYFTSHPDLQEKYINALIEDTLNFISANNLSIYIGQKITGTMRFKTITANLSLYGMLAGAHLAGTNNLKRFLLDGYNPNDGFTSLADYAALFSSKITGLDNILPILLAFIPAIVLYYI
jgi:hypothetical protein